jgi:amino acid transporter
MYFYVVFSGITITISISKYLSTMNVFSQFKNSSVFQKVISIILLLIMSFINYLGIESSAILANTIGVLMIVVLLGTILISFKFWDYTTIVTSSNNVSWDSFVISSVLSLFLFNGYDFLVKISDESANPENNKTAIIYTLTITTFIYAFIIISALCVLGYKTSGSTHNIITKIYEVLTNSYISSFVYVIGAVVMFNTAFLSFLSANKFVQGLGNDNRIIFSDFFKQTSKNDSPSNAIFITLIISILFSILNNEVLMAVFSNVSCVLSLILISISVLIIRWNERNDLKLQQTNNYIPGNINNIPVVVVINVCLIFYMFFEMIKNKFWIGTV